MGTRADNLDGSLTEIQSGKRKGKWRVQFTQVDDQGVKSRIDHIFAKHKAGKEFLSKYSREELRSVAKLHFKTLLEL